jgi:hypothetical protein
MCTLTGNKAAGASANAVPQSDSNRHWTVFKIAHLGVC